MACNVARYKDEAEFGLSTTATLVGSPELSPCLARGKPTSPLLTRTPFTQALPVADVKRAAAARINQATGPPPVQRLGTSDFRVLRVLGHGGQGTVLLVEYLSSGRLYALKMIKKQGLRLKEYRLAFQEQDASKLLAGNPWCAQLKGSFEDEEYFYLLSVSRFLLCSFCMETYLLVSEFLPWRRTHSTYLPLREARSFTSASVLRTARTFSFCL